MRIVKTIAVLGLSALVLAGCSKHHEEEKHYTTSADDNGKFLADNGARKDVTTLPDGLQYRVINAGHGKAVTSPGDTVTVTYKGWTIDGHVFDRTKPGDTASFQVGRLIPGWTEALLRMHVGDEWQIVVPADLGYGAEGAGEDIGPNQTLVFNMQLINVTPPEQP
jgi:FKBP-type peptidyl-prolyl cis-trans isomerase